MALRREYHGNVRAPEFPTDLEWLNTARPLSLASLRGKLVLLDFWTYGCINCMHVVPDLKRLEAEYGDVLVVIGVHSAKFANEKDVENLRQTILRFDLTHPVVNDRDFEVWQSYVVRAWPTTVLIDPRGYVLAAHSGEGVYEAYHELLGTTITRFEAEGILDRTPMRFALEREQAREAVLSYPGKVLADELGDRLFIADSNHHRIVMTDLNGHVRDVIGSGTRGLLDGTYEESCFSGPQGMALIDDVLYVADTENHAIRAVELESRGVRTVAGDGILGYRGAEGPLAGTRMNSPWDLVAVDGKLYIAMAGTHQLWVLDEASDRVGPFAGSGREGLFDAPLVRAALAQPSGITTDGTTLYFADSEASAIRSADLSDDGKVSTIIGEGLFAFGDVDGVWPEARLQHPLGITYHQGTLYVADTYNHKLKTLDPTTGRVARFLGEGDAGWRDGLEPQFYEPSGLSSAQGKLYVADTNNHVVRVVDLAMRSVRTLTLSDPEGLLGRGVAQPQERAVRLPEQRVAPGEGMIRLTLRLPAGYHLNETAPSRLVWGEMPAGVEVPEGPQVDLVGRTFPLTMRAVLALGRAVLQAEVSLYYCQSEASVCLVHMTEVEIPLWVMPRATAESVEIELNVSET